ncbi:MAG: hypothetical protein KC657_07885 [Myxococcales bacterium]|nr:hypothetical protein [Myxococcales bacterium]
MSHLSRCRLGAPLAVLAALHTVTLSTPGLAQQPKPADKPAAAPAADAKEDAPGGSAGLIKKGQQLFDDQQYEESIQALSAALLRPDNTANQRVEIYRLLALNYITLGREQEAESAVRGLLVIAPKYQIPATESPRFRDFFADARKKWEAEGRPGLVKDAPKKTPVTLRHQSPSQVDSGQSVEITAKLDDPEGKVSSVRIFYRAGSSGAFDEAEARVTDGTVRANIPGSSVQPPLVEYYLQGIDVTGAPVVSRGEATDPLRIAVSSPSKGWVLPVAIGGGVLGAVAIVGVLALAGVFSGSSRPPPGGGGAIPATVSIGIRE